MNDVGAVSVLALELEKMLELRIQSAQSERNTLREALEAIDAKLKKIIAVIGKRPTHTDAELAELARNKEFVHATTNMTLMQEKEFIREMDSIRHKRKDLIEYNKKQAEIEVLKGQRLVITNDLKEKDYLLDELYTGSRKLSVGVALKCNPSDVVEKKISIPEDNMSRVIGKGGSGIKGLEELYQVVIHSERANVLRIMGLEDSVNAAFGALSMKANSVTVTLNLQLALKACLMTNKAASAKAIQEKYDVIINFNKADTTCKIFGQADGVAAAKEEILAVPYSKFKVKVDAATIPRLVGKGGVNLRSMYDENLLQIDLLKDESAVAIYGLHADAAPVAEAIKRFCSENKDASETFPVSHFVLHNCLQDITSIQKKGAFIDCSFGKSEEECSITVRGAHGPVMAALEEVKAVIHDFNANTIEIEYHPSSIPSLIGRKGETINKLRADFSTAIINLSGSKVHVHSQDNVVREAARNAMNSIANSNYSEVIPMERDSTITLRGSVGEATRNKLQSDLNLGVSIDTDNETVRLVGRQEDVEAGKGILTAFITQSHSVEMSIDPEDGSAVSSLISELESKYTVHVILTNKRQHARIIGSKSNCAKAKAALQQILEGAKGSGAMLVHVDPADFLVIIGNRGRNLDALEKQLDVKIDILKSKDSVRLRGHDELLPTAKAELARIITENSKTSVTVNIPNNISMDTIMRCVNEAYKVFTLELTLRVADKSITIKGRQEIAEAAKTFLLEHMTGVLTATIHLVEQHATAIVPSRFSAVAESFGVNIRLDIAKSVLVVTGTAASLRPAVEDIYSLLSSLFPLMYEQRSVSALCMMDLGAFHVQRVLEKESGAEVFMDRVLGRVFVRGEGASVRTALRLIDERIAVWEETHTTVDNVDEATVSNLLAKQGTLLSSLEKETNVSIKVNRVPRSLLLEGSTKKEVLTAKATIVSKLSLTPAEEKASSVSNSWEANIHPDVVGTIIGKQGVNIKKLRTDTGAQIDYDQDACVVKVSGSEETVAAAREKIQEIIDSKTPSEISIDPEAVPLMIGTKGANIRAMETESGARIDVDKTRSVVVVRGTQASRDAAMLLVQQKLVEAGFSEKAVVAVPSKVTSGSKSIEVGLTGDFLAEETAAKNYNKEKRLAKQNAFKIMQELEAAAVTTPAVSIQQIEDSIYSAMTSVSEEMSSLSLTPDREDDINFFGLPSKASHPYSLPTHTDHFSENAPLNMTRSSNHVPARGLPTPPIHSAANSHPPEIELDANTAFLLNLLNTGSTTSSSSKLPTLDAQADFINFTKSFSTDFAKPVHHASTLDADIKYVPSGITPPGLSRTPSQDAYGRKLDGSSTTPNASSTLHKTFDTISIPSPAVQGSSNTSSSEKYFKSKSGFSVRL